MGKRIFWIFFLSLSAAIASLVIYVQSEHFAGIIKRELHHRLAGQLGVSVEFDRLEVNILPPGFGMKNARMEILRPDNELGLPMDSVLKAERLGLNLRALQGISRGLTINKFFLSGAEIRIKLPQKTNTGNSPGTPISALVSKPLRVPVSDEFYLYLRQIELRDTVVDISVGTTRVNVDNIKYFSVSPSSGHTTIVYNLEKAGYYPGGTGRPQFLEAFSGNLEISPKEVKITTLDIQRGEVAAHIEGALAGNIDVPDRMKGNLRAIVRGTANGLAEFVPDLKGMTGDISAELHAEGDSKNYALKGTVALEKFKHGMWEFDRIDAAGEFNGSEISLESVKVAKGAGVISIKPLSLQLPLQKLDRVVELEFSKVNFHSFAGELLKDVNNIEAELNGSLAAKISLAKTGSNLKLVSLEIQPDLELSQFELNNQNWGKTRTKHVIFGLRRARLQGSVDVKDGNLDIPGAKITFATGVLNVSGGVTAKDGFQIRGTAEKIDLGAEAGAVGGIPLKGVGAFGVRVYGPADKLKIDFTLGTKESNFVDIAFGELNGTLTLDDNSSVLSILGVQGKRGTTSYRMNGFINLASDSDRLDIEAAFSKATPDELFTMFAEQIKDISWIPHGMQGEVSGKVRVHGGYTDVDKTLLVTATLQARDLLYKGEHVSELRAEAGLNAGTYFARNVWAKKYNTLAAGEISYSPQGRMKYWFKADKGKLRDIDYFSSLQFPIDAAMSAQGNGEGPWDKLKSRTEVRISNAHVHTQSVPDLTLAMDTDNGATNIEGIFGARSGVLGLQMHPQGGSRLGLEFNQANFSFLLCILNKLTCGDPGTSAAVSGAAKFTWPGNDWLKLSGSGEFRGLTFGKRDYRVHVPGVISLTANGGMLRFKPFEVVGDDTRFQLDLAARADLSEVNARAKGEADMQFLELITGLIEESKGLLRINAGVSGSKKDLDLFGDFWINNGYVRASGVDAPAEALKGNIHLQGSRATVTSLEGNIGGGSLTGSGYVELFLDRAPVFNLALNMNNNRLKFFPVNYAEFDSARLTLTGDKPPYVFGGSAKVRKMVMRRNFDLSDSKQIRTSKYLPSIVSGDKGFYEIKIKALAESGMLVQNDLLDAEFRGEVTLLNSFEFPQITGRAELVRGKLLFRNAAFNLDHAVVRLPSPDVFDPQFSIGGQTTVDGYKITIFASGSADNKKITFSSNPSLPQEDILSLLAFGIKGDETKRVSPEDLTAITYTEVGSILLEQLKINKDLQSKGFRLVVTPYVSDNEANIIRPRSVNEAASPKVLVQKKIFSNLDATLGSTFGSSQTQDLEASVEYHLNKRVSVDGVFEQKQTLEAAEKSSSYGADIKFRWGFK